MDAKRLAMGAAAAAILAIGGIGAATYTQSAAAQDDPATGRSANFSREMESDDDADARSFPRSAVIGFAAAEDTAQGEVSGKVVGVSLDEENGLAAYDVDVYGENGRLHEIKVDAADGSILASENEDTDDSTETGRLFEEASIDHEAAANAALNEIPGRLLESKLDDEEGRAVYEVSVLGEDGAVHELTVDAGDGNILSQETEDSDD